MQINKPPPPKTFFDPFPETQNPILKSDSSKYITQNAPLSRYLISPSITLPLLKHESQSSKYLTPLDTIKSDAKVLKKSKLIPLKNPKSQNFESTLSKGQLLIIDKIIYNKIPFKPNKSLTLSPIPKSFLACRYKYDDSYSYYKFMKSHDVTPFNKLLFLSRDSSSGNYPYLTRIMKEIKRIESEVLVKPHKKPRAYLECNCDSNKSTCFYREKPKTQDFERLAGRLEVFYLKKVDTLFNENFVVVVFEGTIGWLENGQVKFRETGVKFLKAVQNFFKIIILTTKPDLAEMVLNSVEKEEINLSGLFIFKGETSKELANLSLIYQQFSIEKPESQVLVISSLEKEVYKDEPIFSQEARLKKCLNVKICPVGLEKNPITILVNHVQMNDCQMVFDELMLSFKRKMGTGLFDFSDWVKCCKGKFRVLSSSLPYEIVMSGMPLKKFGRTCKLHRTLIRNAVDLPSNYFVLYLE